jgi:hypothetical protein
MLLRANAPNLRKFSADLLGNGDTPENRIKLRREVLAGFVREPGHISHSRAAHLERINAILKSYGVEGMLLDRHGEDRSGDCSMQDVRHDIQYVNAGDPYTITILYYNGRLMIGDWGSIAERCA